MSYNETYCFEDSSAMSCKLEKAMYIRGQATIVGLHMRRTILSKLLKFFLPANLCLKNLQKKTRPPIILFSCFRNSV